MKYANYRSIFKMYELVQPFLKYSLPLEENIPAGKVLVIAPHQDDESIGCGGTMIKHVQSGGTVETVFCTSDKNYERMTETEQAAQILGSKLNYFLQFEIRSLYNNIQQLSERFITLFEKAKPDVIFLPFMIDNHQDHIAISKAFFKAYKKKKIDCMIYAYSVWTTLIPNVITDISEQWDEKQKAIECYKTQTATRDYTTMASSIAKYWAVVKGKDTKYCEAFFRASAGEYAHLVKKIL